MISGKHLATKIDGKITQPKRPGSEPQASILFQLEETGERITWFGSLSEAAAKYTAKALAVCGVEVLNGDFVRIEGPGPKVELDIQEEANDKGEMRMRVKWVNSIGGSLELSKPADPGVRAQYASKMAGHIAKAKAELGPSTTLAPNGNAGKSDIPF